MADSEVQFNAPLFRSTLEKLVARVNDRVQTALAGEAETLRSDANGTVPVDTGELKASSFTDSGLTEHGNPAATVGYDDPKAPAVHEGFHGGEKSKTASRFWLQTAANRFAPAFNARIASVVSGAVQG